jgi:hypothetical protein
MCLMFSNDELVSMFSLGSCLWFQLIFVKGCTFFADATPAASTPSEELETADAPARGPSPENSAPEDVMASPIASVPALPPVPAGGTYGHTPLQSARGTFSLFQSSAQLHF